jgi:hypothetical protein
MSNQSTTEVMSTQLELLEKNFSELAQLKRVIRDQYEMYPTAFYV